MNLREKFYSEAISIIEELYRLSKYDPDIDFYRIWDICNALDKNQIKSKEWLVDKLLETLPYQYLPLFDSTFPESEPKNIFIAGGWYGITALLLREKYKLGDIHTCDLDPVTKIYGEKFIDCEQNNIHFKVDDAISYFLENKNNYGILINTSCEHMDHDDVTFMCQAKREHTIVCLQNNNFHEIDSHIGCHDSLSDFADSLKLNQIIYQGVEKLDNCDRYMVIGK